MKKLAVLGAVITLFTVSTSYAKLVLRPIYSLDFAENTCLFNRDITSKLAFLSPNLANNLGLVIQPNKEHTVLVLYQLKYSGAGVKMMTKQPQEAIEFTDRNMDHFVFLQYSWQIMPMFTLKSRLNYMNEFYRSGSNEVWGTGKYDFIRPGLDIKLDVNLLGWKFIPGIQYGSMSFPNNVDLLKSQQAGGAQAEKAGGMNDQIYTQISVGTEKQVFQKVSPFKLNLLFDNKPYVRQKVVAFDGTYGNTLQLDNTVSVNTSIDLPVANFVFSPSLSLRTNASNQNYLFPPTKPGDMSTARFISKYYDYNQYSGEVEMTWNITPTNELVFCPNYVYKIYPSRIPRDTKNAFIESEKQYNQFLFLTLTYGVRWNPTSKWYFTYTYATANSNMKYEVVPYNYSAHYFEMKFAFSY